MITRSFTETVLFASVAANATFLLFIAGVFRKITDAVSPDSFKELIAMFFRYSTKSPFMIVFLNLPFLLAIPYYCLFGFANWWMTTGLALWLVAGSLGKYIKLPVYKSVSAPDSEDKRRIETARNTFNSANLLQAALYSAATIIIAVGLYLRQGA